MKTIAQQQQKEEDTAIRQSKVWQHIALFIFGVILVAGGLFAFWSVQSSKVLDIHNDPVPARPPEVKANGGIIILDIDYCKLSDARGLTKVYLVGEEKGQKPEINWPVDESPKGCVHRDIPIPIPASLQTDVYHIVFEVTYRVNPLKEQVVIFRSRSFKVINEKLQPGDAKPVVQ